MINPRPRIMIGVGSIVVATLVWTLWRPDPIGDLRVLPWPMFVIAGIALMSTVVPKTAVSIACGTLYPVPQACGLIVVIATSAAMVNYTVGRILGRGFSGDSDALDQSVEYGDVRDRSRWMRRLIEIGGDAGFGVHLMIRLSPVPSMLISTMCGVLRCRPIPYGMAAAVAAVTQWMWVISAATTVDAVGGEDHLKWVSAGLSVIATLAMSWWIARKVSRQWFVPAV